MLYESSVENVNIRTTAKYAGRMEDIWDGVASKCRQTSCLEAHEARPEQLNEIQKEES